MSQLAFDISLPPNYKEEDFLVAKCNRDAWAALQQWDNDKTTCSLIKGPKSSGKSHLAHIWAQKNHAKIMGAYSLSNETSPENIFEEQNSKNLVIEDCEKLEDESTLFHFLNFMRNNINYRLLLTVDEQACWNGFELADLRSRLQALPQAEIHQPDDALLTALLVKSFQDKQVDISQTSLGYLLPRIERSFDGVKNIIEKLDQHAIAKKRPITRSLIQEVLTQS